MAVYSYKMTNALLSVVGDLAEKFFAHMSLTLSPDEFVQAFINPEHVPTLHQMEEMVGYVGSAPGGLYLDLDLGRASVGLSFGVRAPLIVPRYVNGGLQPTCPPDLRDKITAWGNERIRLGFLFGDVYDGLNYLNGVCDDVNTLTTLLPCFPYILSRMSSDEESKVSKRASKIANNRRVGRLPRLTRAAKERLQEASAIMSSVSLVETAEVAPVPSKHARLHFNPRWTAQPFVKSNPQPWVFADCDTGHGTSAQRSLL